MVQLNTDLLSKLSGTEQGLKKDLQILDNHKNKVITNGSSKRTKQVYHIIEDNPGIDIWDMEDLDIPDRTINQKLSELWNELMIMRYPDILDMRKTMNYTTHYVIDNDPAGYMRFIEKNKENPPRVLRIR